MFGLAPKNTDSGTSLNSATNIHAGSKALQNLFIFSCSSHVGTKVGLGKR